LGSFIILSISKVPEAIHPFRNCLIKMIINEEIKSNVQVEEFVKFFKITTYQDDNVFDNSNKSFDKIK